MARDINSLMDQVRNAREVVVTDDGQVEDVDEARKNARAEERDDRAPRARTRLKSEVFGAEDAVRVETGVLASMYREAERYPGETGGIVVGPDDHTVTELIPSGPAAARSAARYELDAAVLQPLLVRAEDRGLRFLGIWHSHPRGCTSLSSLDRVTAAGILADPEYCVSRLLLPLSVRTQAGFATEFFLAEGTEPAVRALRIVALSGGGDDAVESSTSGLAAAGPWATTGSFFGTGYGRSRLQADREALAAAGWTVTVRRHGETECAVILARDKIDLLLVLPREYPFGRPDLFEIESGGATVVRAEGIPELVSWSSSRSLVRVAEEAVAARWRAPRWLRQPLGSSARRSTLAARNSW